MDDGVVLHFYLENISGLVDDVHLSCNSMLKSLNHFCNVGKVSQLDIPVGSEGDLWLLKDKFSVKHLIIV